MVAILFSDAYDFHTSRRRKFSLPLPIPLLGGYS